MPLKKKFSVEKNGFPYSNSQRNWFFWGRRATIVHSKRHRNDKGQHARSHSVHEHAVGEEATHFGHLAKKNTHEVPETTLRRVIDTYEPTSLKEILRSLQMEHHLQVKPSLRTHPAPRVKKGAPQDELMETTAVAQAGPGDIFSFGQSAPINWSEIQKKTTRRPSSAALVRFHCQTASICASDGGASADRTHRTEPGVYNRGLAAPRERNRRRLDGAGARTRWKGWSAAAGTPSTHESFAQQRPLRPGRGQNDSGQVPRRLCQRERYAPSIPQPSLPVIYLWELFVNCNGDIEWTMDILLKDKSTMHFVSAVSQALFGGLRNCQGRRRAADHQSWCPACATCGCKDKKCGH
jgi:hypothetical protein